MLYELALNLGQVGVKQLRAIIHLDDLVPW